MRIKIVKQMLHLRVCASKTALNLKKLEAKSQKLVKFEFDKFKAKEVNQSLVGEMILPAIALAATTAELAR